MCHRYFQCICLLTLVVLLDREPCWPSVAGEATGGDPPRWFELASTVEGTIQGGSSDCYFVKLHAGEFLEASVEQLGMDARIDISATDSGEHLLQIDTLSTVTGSESILLVAERERSFQIEIRPADEAAAAGKYRLTVHRLEAATQSDRVKAQAVALMAAAGSLRRAGRRSALELASDQLDQAVRLWRSQADDLGEATALLRLAQVEDELGRKRESQDHLNAARDLFHAGGNLTGEALCLARLGASHDELGDPASALQVLNQAFGIFQRLMDPKGTALVLALIGSVHDKKSDRKEALQFYEKSLALSRQIGDRLLQSEALNYMGIALTQMDRSQEALDRFAEALQLLESLGDRRNQAWVLVNIGVVYGNLGDPKQALQYYLRALPIRRETGDRYGEALTLHNMAAIYTDTGDLQSAMDAFHQALRLWREVGDKRFEARTLLGLGKLYSVLGEPERALAAYNQALPLTQAAEDKVGAAMTWLNLGWEHTALQSYDMALQELLRSRALWHEIGSPRREAAALINLADLELARGEAETALEYAQQALALRRQVKDRRGEALGLHTVGKCYAALGKHSDAIDSFVAALALRTATGDRSGEAATLFYLAKMHRQTDSLTKALDNVEAALRLIDDVRAQILGVEAKASFLSTKDAYYRFYIDLLMELARRKDGHSFEEMALEANEARRARGLRDALVLANGEVRRGVPPDLWTTEREIEQKVARLDLRLRTLLYQGEAGERKVALERELDDGLEELSQIRARIAERSPQYAALMQPPMMSAAAIQKLLTDENSLLLEVMLGEQRSFAWLVSQEGIKVAELPAGREVEDAASALYEALTRSRERLGRRSFEVEALRLANWLLRPFKDQLGTKRLLVVADGALQQIPFGMLPDPTSSSGTYQPLVTQHEVVSLPSASVLAALRWRLPASTSERTIAVIADPVVGRTDPRLRNKDRALSHALPPLPKPETMASDSPLSRAIEDLGGEDLVRLPFSTREAAAIEALLSRQSILQATGFAANRELVTSGKLHGYPILHFATHGLLNTRHPELSGLVLSLYDDQGREKDGFLRVHEIYKLDLPADLVVLSACRTALGKDVKGEGLIGLTRAFFYAGAAGVVSSLWKVDDRATAELMKRFYRKLLKDKLPPATALREAQLSMWRDPAWQAPYYWAGFIFQGDWQRRPLIQ